MRKKQETILIHFISEFFIILGAIFVARYIQFNVVEGSEIVLLLLGLVLILVGLFWPLENAGLLKYQKL
jgi:predicted acyltransferase